MGNGLIFGELFLVSFWSFVRQMIKSPPKKKSKVGYTHWGKISCCSCLTEPGIKWFVYNPVSSTEKHIVSSDNVQIDLPSFLTYLKERENELRNWDVIIDTNSYKKQLGFEIGGLNINPANRLTRVDERFISNTKSITTTVGQNSTILSNDIANVTASKEEIDKAKKKIDEFKGKLGLAKAISLVTARPILYITIYRIKLEEIREGQPFYDQYKEFHEFSKNLDVYASLSYRLPETELIEEPKEVWKNADIDTIGEDYDDGDD